MRTYRVITGPTASGKTDWLLKRAEQVPIRVISADSRQVCRLMDIGTGKPTSEELRRLPHFGIDLIDPDHSFSAHDFILMAAGALKQLEEFSGEVWVCGGTGLYIRTLTEALPLGPPPRPRLRQALAALVCDRGSARVAADLRLQLREVRNPMRVLRYAEKAAEEDSERIYTYAGLDPALSAGDFVLRAEDYASALSVIKSWQCTGIFVLDPGPILEARIKERVAGMFDRGLVAEVEHLRAGGFGSALNVAQGIGYRQAGLLLDGNITEAQAIAQAIVRTRQYAKRQRTYFRGRGWTTPPP